MKLSFTIPKALTSLFSGKNSSPGSPATAPVPANKILELSGNEFSELLEIQDEPAVAEKLQNTTIQVKDHYEIPPAVRKLPPSVEFMKDVDMHTGAALAEFNAKVHGVAKFSHLQALKSIGEQAEFQELVVDSTQLHRFAGTVHKSAVFKNSALAAFDPKARFLGDLDAAGTRITKFNQPVGGSVNLSGSKFLREVGPEAKIGKDVCLSHTFVESYQGQAGGNADFYYTPKLTEVGEAARIGGNLSAHGSGIINFAGQVGGNADFTQCKQLKKLAAPASFGGTVQVGGTNIEEVSCPVGRLEAPGVTTLKTVTPTIVVGKAVDTKVFGKLMELD